MSFHIRIYNLRTHQLLHLLTPDTRVVPPAEGFSGGAVRRRLRSPAVQHSRPVPSADVCRLVAVSDSVCQPGGQAARRAAAQRSQRAGGAAGGGRARRAPAAAARQPRAQTVPREGAHLRARPRRRGGSGGGDDRR